MCLMHGSRLTTGLKASDNRQSPVLFDKQKQKNHNKDKEKVNTKKKEYLNYEPQKAKQFANRHNRFENDSCSVE